MRRRRNWAQDINARNSSGTRNGSRRHSSRMRTTYWVAITLVSTCGGVGPEMNKSEHVSSDDHQMSVGRGYVTRSDFGGIRSPGLGGGLLCNLSHQACSVPLRPHPVNKQMPVKTLPFRNFVCGQ